MSIFNVPPIFDHASQGLASLAVVFVACMLDCAAAQAPASDIIPWPSGMLLLATVIYTGMVFDIDELWAIEPAVGPFLWNGLPFLNLSDEMNEDGLVLSTFHFAPRVPPVTLGQAGWVPGQKIDLRTRREVLGVVSQVLSCMTYVAHDNVPARNARPNDWTLRSSGLLYPATVVQPASTSPPERHSGQPTTRDYLLFAAIYSNAAWEEDIIVYSSSRPNVLFSTRGTSIAAIFDVDSAEMAETVVVAILARSSPSPLRALLDPLEKEDTVRYIDRYRLGAASACALELFLIGSPVKSAGKVSTTLEELAASYYAVVHHLNQNKSPPGRQYAQAHSNGSLWIAILGGELLAEGRLTIRHVRCPCNNSSPGYANNIYLVAISGLLTKLERALQPIPDDEARASAFDALLPDPVPEKPAVPLTGAPFLLASILCQAIVCYFLSVGTSAGVWTSVAMANALFIGRLPDLHNASYSRHTSGQGDGTHPGFKMNVPGSKDLMAFGTLNRSIPAQGDSLRPGFLLNITSIVAAILGSIFQRQTRSALGFDAFVPAQEWVLYTSAGISIMISLFLLGMSWWQWTSYKPSARIAVVFTVPASLLVSALALYFQLTRKGKLWPILDAITFLSGIPLGMYNGAKIPMEPNMLHLILMNRWVMGGVASSFGNGAVVNGSPSP